MRGKEKSLHVIVLARFAFLGLVKVSNELFLFQVDKWQVLKDGRWVDENSLVLQIRRKKVSIKI